MPIAKVGDINVYFEVHGEGDKVLFISGTNGDLRQLPFLGKGPLERQFQVAYFDQRGLGQTSRPDGPYSMAEYGDDAAGLLDALGWESAHVVGVSFGGMVAQHLALRHPSRVQRLILACTSSGGAGGSSYDLLQLEGLSPQDRMRAWLPLLDSRNDTSTTPFSLAPGMDPIVAAMAARPVQRDDAARGARLQLQARHGHDVWDQLPSVTQPTLVIGGLYDEQAPVQNQRNLQARIPNSELVLCEGGHMFMYQDPSAFPAIIKFVSHQ